MTSNEPILRKPLRLWPGVALAIIMVLVRVGAPLVTEDGVMAAILGSVAGGALILLWWLFFSRAPWSERLAALALMTLATVVTHFIVHPSIRGGLMGRMVPVFLAVPGFPLVLVLSLLATRRLGSRPRLIALATALALTCGLFAMIRTDGILGGMPQLTWRWTPTAEERLLAQARNEPAPAAPAAASPSPAPQAPAKTADSGAPSATSAKSSDTPPAVKTAEPPPATPPAVRAAENADVRWAGFRGPRRDSIIRGVQIDTDWVKSPPTPLWRRPIGPGWSSFAVQGDLIYTQEQRGDDEIVAAYKLATGEPAWKHRDAARFYESNGGPGPRGTPTLSNGRVYSLGATGIVNALDAGSGAVVWTRNAVTDTGVTIPGWGITSSPLAIDDMVVVAASGRLVAYDAATGTPRWTRTSGGGSYSSPHVTTIGGVTQIVLLSGGGAMGVAPADGAVLWQHPLWQSAIGIVQPAAADDGVLIAAGDAMGGIGMRRLAVARGASGWTVEERWTSRGLKPYFNDFVVHKGHVYGFDGSILSCIDLNDGARKWKGGRYGGGQLVLLADQDLLLVISEEGELAVVKAAPDQFTELAQKLPAIEGKTWNHPVIVGDVLLVRNGQEMAAFRLPLARRSTE
jgi:outer membrane protein assembly factor BamB